MMRKRSSSLESIFPTLKCPINIFYCKSVSPVCKSVSRLVCFDLDIQTFGIFLSFIRNRSAVLKGRSSALEGEVIEEPAADIQQQKKKFKKEAEIY